MNTINHHSKTNFLEFKQTLSAFHVLNLLKYITYLTIKVYEEALIKETLKNTKQTVSLIIHSNSLNLTVIIKNNFKQTSDFFI